MVNRKRKTNGEDRVAHSRAKIASDGPGHYPKSSVLYTHFMSSEVRKLFAYLREKERFFQDSVEEFKGTAEGILYRARLEEVENQLIWMTATFAFSTKGSERV